MKMNASGVKKASEVSAGGGFLNVAGGFHFLVRKCEEGDTFHDVELEVLAGTVKGTERQRLNARYFNEDQEGECNPGLLKLVLAAGVLKPGESRDVDLVNELPGKTFLAKTFMRKGKKVEGQEQKEFCSISMNDQWPLSEAKDDEYASKIPLGKVPDGDDHGGGGDAPPKKGGGSDWDV